MKINEKASLNQFFQGSSQPVANLEQWLKRSHKKGDDYYWYHQQELENSALQFNALNLEAKAEKRGIENETPVHQSLQKIEQKSTPNLLENWSTQFHELKSEISKIEPRFLPDCPLSSRNPGKAIPDNFRPQHQSKILNSINFSAAKILPRAFIFKKHQLFISKNEAELSLNGANLSRPEIKELVRILKKLFYDQGLKLDKLIINGETQ